MYVSANVVHGKAQTTRTGLTYLQQSKLCVKFMKVFFSNAVIDGVYTYRSTK